MNRSKPGLPVHHQLPTPGAYSNSCPSSQWCYPAISSSVFPFSSWPQSLPASGSFPMSQLFASGGQSTGFTIRRWNVDCSKSTCMSQTLKSVRLKRDHLNNFAKQHFALMSKTKENEASPRLHMTKMLRSSAKSSQCENHSSSLKETVSISLESNTTRT